MYIGFKYKILASDFNEMDYKNGQDLFAKNNSDVSRELSKFISPDGVLDGTEIQSSWFKQIPADIFISHSHNDKHSAISLAGWLNRNFGIIPFVDSSVWGYADQLQLKIDKKFCFDPARNTFDYNIRNITTAHVKSMLCTALAKMIDRAECLIFLDTLNSITTADLIEHRTYSPWLHYEIAISSIISKPLKAHLNRNKYLKKGLFSEVNEAIAEYSVDMTHLKELNKSILNRWSTQYENTDPTPEFPLDILYAITKKNSGDNNSLRRFTTRDE